MPAPIIPIKNEKRMPTNIKSPEFNIGRSGLKAWIITNNPVSDATSRIAKGIAPTLSLYQNQSLSASSMFGQYTRMPRFQQNL